MQMTVISAAFLGIAMLVCAWSFYHTSRELEASRQAQANTEKERDEALRASAVAQKSCDEAIQKLKAFEAKPDLTAADLLHDLTRRGQAVLRVEVIDPGSILLRSPRLG